MKFSSLRELIVYLTLTAGVGAAALGTNLATSDTLPSPRTVVVSTLDAHPGPHDHAHDPFGRAVEGKEVTIDFEYGARATDAGGDVAVSRRALHAHATQGEDGKWQLERVDSVRRISDERYTTDDPGVWEKAELKGELPHDGDAHAGHNHDPLPPHDNHNHGADKLGHTGVLDHLGHPLEEGERQVDTAFEVRITNAEGEAAVTRGGAHQHWVMNDDGERELAASETYFRASNERTPGHDADADDDHDHADHDNHAGHVHN